MRVIAGTRRSMPLKAPVGMDTRPTQDRTKETLFNVLQNEIPGAEFLDLFAGSGAISIEALSRGASHATLVENNKNAVSCIKDNLKFTKFSDEATLMETDVMAALYKLDGHKEFDIVFMDPPYNLEIEAQVLKTMNNMASVTEYTTVIMEASLKRDLSFVEECGFRIVKVKQYKTNQHIFLTKNSYNTCFNL